MTRFAALLFVAVVPAAIGLVPSASFAADWTRTFPADAISGHLPGRSEALIVIGAASGDPETRAAAIALERGWREGGRTALVMDDAALGSAAGMVDSALVEKCGAFPVTAIAIVRVFKKTPPRVTVAIYSKDGTQIGGFSTVLGNPVAPPAQSTGSGAGAGVSLGAAESVSEVSRMDTATMGSAEEQYLQQFIWFGEYVRAADYSLKRVRPLRGKYRKGLTWKRFYTEVGAPDLAARYARNQKIRVGAFGSSLALFAVAFLQPWNLEQDQTTLLALGGAATVVGGGAYFWDPHPIRFSEARRLVDEHNGRLKTGFGISALERPEHRIHVVLGPRAPEGGHVGLSISF